MAKQTKIEAALRDTKSKIKNLEIDIMLFTREKNTLIKVRDTLEKLDANDKLD